MTDGRRIRLDQVANVSDTVAEQRSAALLNGKPVVGFEITRTRGAGETEVAEGVRKELDVLNRLGVDVSANLNIARAELVVDAIFGTGLSRAPEGLFSEWIETINASGARIVAVDVPSGLDSDSGVAYAPTVRADLTVTLGLPKPGLLSADGPRLCGDVWVADIGVPFEAYAELGLHVPPDLFAASDRIRLGMAR